MIRYAVAPAAAVVTAEEAGLVDEQRQPVQGVAPLYLAVLPDGPGMALSDSAAAIWEVVEQHGPLSTEETAVAVAGHYAVAVDTLRADVESVLSALAAAGAVVVADQPEPMHQTGPR
ncbi:MAG TPA: PqqD family protein [Dermatophilaceae bacterium]|nr:PqqD family protein [Dermatophilaceae bacterium]